MVLTRLYWMPFVGYMGQFHKNVAIQSRPDRRCKRKSWNVCFSDGFRYLFGIFTAFYTSTERDLQHIVCTRRSSTGKEKRALTTNKVRKPTYCIFSNVWLSATYFILNTFFVNIDRSLNEKREKQENSRTG